MRIRTSITLPEELQARAEQYAAETKRSFSGLVELALERLLTQDSNVDFPPDDDSAKGGPTGISKIE